MRESIAQQQLLAIELIRRRQRRRHRWPQRDRGTGERPRPRPAPPGATESSQRLVVLVDAEERRQRRLPAIGVFEVAARDLAERGIAGRLRRPAVAAVEHRRLRAARPDDGQNQREGPSSDDHRLIIHIGRLVVICEPAASTATLEIAFVPQTSDSSPISSSSAPARSVGGPRSSCGGAARA